jgi:Homeodomain-like domain
MLVELGVVEQRYQAVLEVLNDGASVSDVARRYGVARQTVHVWLRKHAAEGAGWVGRSEFAAFVVPASDGSGGRGAGRGDAPGASGVGAAHDPVLA